MEKEAVREGLSADFQSLSPIYLVIESEKSDPEGKLEELEPFLAISDPSR